MAFKCKIGFHDFNGCKCSSCGKIRDEQHDWSKDCENCSMCGKTRNAIHNWNKDCEKCSNCGKVRENQHAWNGCKCSKCYKTRDQHHVWEGCECSVCDKIRDENHDWSKDCEKCSICGKTRENPHVWIDCKCSNCAVTRDENHSWDGSFCSRCNEFKYIANKLSIISWLKKQSFSIPFYDSMKKGTTLMRELGERSKTELFLWSKSECYLAETMVIVVAIRMQGIIQEKATNITDELIEHAIADITDPTKSINEVDGIIVLSNDFSKLKFYEIVRNIFIKINKIDFPDFLDDKKFEIVLHNSMIALKMLCEKDIDITKVFKVRHELYGYWSMADDYPLAEHFCGIHYWDKNKETWE
jgi:hypothetical protein